MSADSVVVQLALPLAVAACMVAFPRFRPGVLLCFGIVGALTSSHPERLGLPLGLDRPFIAAAILLAVLDALVQRTQRKPLHPVIVVGAFVGMIASSFAADSLFTRYGMFLVLDRIGIIPLALFALSPFFFRTARDRRRFLGVLVGVGAYLSLTAIFEILGPKALIFPSYIADPSAGLHFGRARGPFVDATAEGLALTICAAASAIAWKLWQSSSARKFALGTGVLCIFGILLTYTRGDWIGAGFGLSVAAFMAARNKMRVIGYIGAVAVALSVVVVFTPSIRGSIESRSNDQAPVIDRKNQYNAAFRVIDEHPLFGLGLGGFHASGGDYFRQSAEYPLSNFGAEVHNVYLARFAELGLLGGSVWAAIFFGLLGQGLRRQRTRELHLWRLGFIAIFLAWCGVALTAPVSAAFPTLVLWCWAGMLVSARKYPDEPENEIDVRPEERQEVMVLK